MKKISIKQTLLAFVGACCLASCNADKGNYDYDEINKVTAFGNISESYSVEVGEELTIQPTLETAFGNEDDLEYTWYYKNSAGWNVLQKGKDFDFTIADPIGMPNTTYTCAFEAKNIKTEAAYRYTFTIRVTGTFNRGYVVLYEKENSFDMGMMVRNAANQYIAKYDILATTAPELEREGVKPYEVNIFADKTAPNIYNKDGSNRSLFLLTDHYTTHLKISDFTWDESYDISNAVENGSTLYDNYISAGKPIVAEKMKVGSVWINGTPYPHIYIYLTDENGKGNWFQQNNYPALYMFSYPMNAYRSDKGKTPFDAAPYLSNGQRGTIFFNRDNNTLAYQSISINDYNTAGFFYTESFTDKTTDGSFNFSEENDGLLYMGERYNSSSGSTGFAILKMTDGTFKFIEFNVPNAVSGMTTNSYKVRASLFDANSPIKDAKFIAAAPQPNNAFVYFVTNDNKVYYADVSGASAVVREITDKVCTDGYDEVTALRFTLPSSSDKYLAIATYNSSLGKDKGGKITFYSLPSASSGELAVAEHKVSEEETIQMEWKDYGKIVSVDYKP